MSGSHLQSQSKSRRQMMVFMPLVVVLIGQFCCDVIGRHKSCSDWSVIVLLLLLICLLFVEVCRFRLKSRMNRL